MPPNSGRRGPCDGRQEKGLSLEQTDQSRAARSEANPDPRTPQVGELVQPSAHPATAWWRGALIGAAALTLALGTLAAVWLLARPLALLFAAIAIAEALTPIVEWLERRMPRAIAVGVVYVGLVLILVGAGWVIVPRLVDQAQLLAENTPDLVNRLESTINRWDPDGSERIIDAARQNVDRFSGVLIDLPFRIVSSLVQIVLVVFMSAYWLLSAPALSRFARGLFPERMLPQVDKVLGELRQSVGGYVRAEAIDAVVMGIVSYIGLRIIGVDYALVLAMLVGLGELVPVIGPLAAAVPAVAVALIDSPTQALIVVGFYAVLQQFESNILLPQTVNKTASIPPLLSIIALFAGAALGGLLGGLIAIPLSGALLVLTTSVAAPALRRWAGRDDE